MRMSLLLAIWCMGPFAYADSSAKARFEKVKNLLLSEYYGKDLNEEQLYEAALKGMLANLNTPGRPWNRLISPTELQTNMNSPSKKLSGIGVEVSVRPQDGRMKVRSVFPGSGAEKAGLRVQDQIVSINGVSLKDHSFSEVIHHLRGEPGTQVELTWFRGRKKFKKAVNRHSFSFPSVVFYPVSQTFKVRAFEKGSASEFENLLKKNHNFSKITIDLRGNSGGVFEEAVHVADLFVPKGAVLGRGLHKNGEEIVFYSEKKPLWSRKPIKIVVNEETASGAEWLAATLKELVDVKIVGTRTFGKWNIQKVVLLSNDSAVRYTFGQFLTPSGRHYEGRGIEPDEKFPSLNRMKPSSNLIKAGLLKSVP
ncbi:MAG: hypothetical protein CL678_03595 [Bdellovibrionaceae bacterium]|nr:hypothetical protein [Pseudobdellovibrionaceae bacterium]|tara:strand:- start:3423 stop:4520 length:1098 start_codon:yes stop_codon:yes gene_type:complete